MAIYWDVSTGIWWHLGGMWRDIMASELDMEGNGGNNMGCGGKEPLRMSDCLTVLLLIVVILLFYGSYIRFRWWFSTFLQQNHIHLIFLMI